MAQSLRKKVRRHEVIALKGKAHGANARRSACPHGAMTLSVVQISAGRWAAGSRSCSVNGQASSSI
jgi:hypothetical protein